MIHLMNVDKLAWSNLVTISMIITHADSFVREKLQICNFIQLIKNTLTFKDALNYAKIPKTWLVQETLSIVMTLVDMISKILVIKHVKHMKVLTRWSNVGLSVKPEWDTWLSHQLKPRTITGTRAKRNVKQLKMHVTTSAEPVWVTWGSSLPKSFGNIITHVS